MTEYDYSPEAHRRHLQTQDRIAKWVDQTEQELSRSRSQPHPPSSSSSSRRVDHRRRSESHNPSTRSPPPPPHYPIFQPSYHSPSTILPGHSISSAPSPQPRSMSVPRQHRPPSLHAPPGPPIYQNPAMYSIPGVSAPLPQNTYPYLRHPPPFNQNLSPAHSHRSQPSNTRSYHTPTRSSSSVAYPGPGSTSYQHRISKSPVVISSAGGSYVIIPPRGEKVDIVVSLALLLPIQSFVL